MFICVGEKVEIFNQVAETLKVRDLATLIAGKTGVEIRNLENPRKEDAENDLQVIRRYCLFVCLFVAWILFCLANEQQHESDGFDSLFISRLL